MGMMARMRGLASWFIILVGGLFVLFMVLSDSRVLEFLGRQSNNVGSINGYDVTYQEYSALVERARSAQVQQTGKEIEESQMDFFRNQVWDALITQKLIEEKMEEFGIAVTDEEIRDALLGPEPPEFLKRNFIDSTGSFNRDLYETALFDARNREILLQVEDAVREQKMQEKLQNLLFATISVSEDEIHQKFIDQTFKMNAQFALVGLNTIPDSTVSISDAELEDYYNSHLDDYKNDPQRRLKYVLFQTKPSQADTLAVKSNLDAIIGRLSQDTSSFKTYVDIYSEQPYSKDSLSLSVIPDEARIPITSAKVGEIIGPVLTYQGYIVYRLINKYRSNETFIRASHILIKSDQGDNEAKKKADEIYSRLVNGVDFAQLAVENSDDIGSAQKGGDLGWFGRGQMVPEFENASFTGSIGVIQRPVKSAYGYHIIKVTGKTNDKYIVEKIVNKIDASATTIDKIYSDAGDFSYLADKNGFESEAELMKYKILESNYFRKDMTVIPGMGASKGLIEFAFGNDIGAVSTVFKVGAGYVVAVVSESKDAEYKPFEDMKESIRNNVLREKKFNKAKEIMIGIKSQIKDRGDLNLAPQIYSKAGVDTAKEFGTDATIPGVGKDYAFINYSLEGELNKVSDPIKGSRGYYLIKVLNRTEFDSTSYNLQRVTLRDNLLQLKKNRVFSDWLAQLKNEADIVDNRHLFYR